MGGKEVAGKRRGENDSTVSVLSNLVNGGEIGNTEEEIKWGAAGIKGSFLATHPSGDARCV